MVLIMAAAQAAGMTLGHPLTLGQLARISPDPL